MTELEVFDDLPTLDAALARVRTARGRIGLVPTMGNLHAGHLSLVDAARADCDFVLATIFINPLQFGANEDLGRYPRSFAADCAALHQAGCDAVFAPDAATMYPEGLEQHTRISVPVVSALHCGQSRPGHFDGVCTVVCKLFNMTRPDHAYFGLKDFQQFHIVSRMVQDLHLQVALHGLPTIREASGLALSSRNGYLDETQRRQAPALYRTLQACARDIVAGARDYAALERQAEQQLHSAGLRPDFVHICRRDTLLPASPDDTALIILAAAHAGATRLIDNIAIDAFAPD